MRLLFVIFVLCVTALLWTAIAIARHIRRHQADADLQKMLAADMEMSEIIDAGELVPTGPPRRP